MAAAIVFQSESCTCTSRVSSASSGADHAGAGRGAAAFAWRKTSPSDSAPGAAILRTASQPLFTLPSLRFVSGIVE